MEHKEIRQMLSSYLDNAVSHAERSEIEKHLSVCENCRTALADLERTLAHLKSLPEVEPPPWLTAKIVAQVRDEAEQKQGFWRRLFLPIPVKLPLEVLALLCLCVTGYYLAHTTAPQMKLTDISREARKEAAPPLAPAQPSPAVPGRLPPASRSTAPAEKKPAVLPPPVSPPNAAEPQGGYASPPPTKAPIDPTVSPAPSPRYRVPEIASRPEAEWAMSEKEAMQRAEAQREALQREASQREEVVKAAREESKTYGVRMKKKASSGAGYPSEVTGASQGRGAAPSEYRPEPVEITLRVDDPAAAVGSIEEAVTRSGGRIVRRTYGETGRLLSVQLEARKYAELIERLERIGTLRKPPLPDAGEDGKVDLLIRW